MNKEYVILSNISKRQIAWRRFKLFGIVFISVILGTFKWADFMPTDVILPIKIGMIALFALTFMWISLYFWSSLFGFLEIIRNRKMPGIKRPLKHTKLTSKTVILMPVYNEEPSKVFANLLAMAQQLSATGQGAAYDFFVLSDSTNPQIWVQEESLWLNTKELFPKEINLFYRHRPKNIARKSGNIEDFCIRFGKHYDFMIVLDADSLMTADTMVTMSQLMEVNTTTGIIQAPPIIINRNSLFARVQQFAGRVYGPIVSAGLAYWQVWDSNYWGHNAIIRVNAFMDCCGLPVFKGQAPFGGQILSHDFVEAALIRRGGWLAWLLPELKGSFEECPPSLLDFAIRDRRWCQGNLQHLRILFSKKFHPVSRLHFTLGIMSYLSSPLWFLFLVTGIGIALWRGFFPPEYFVETKTLFPTWPVFDLVGTVILFTLSMLMLFFPKILGVAAVLMKEKKVHGFGGFIGLIKTLVIETVFSALIAPIMMLFQTKIVFDILLGLDAGWNTQNRDETGTPWRVAFRRHLGHTIIGVGVTAIVYLYATNLFYWILPITVGLMLSIPLSVYSSRESWGKWARRHKLFLIPEEVNKPTVLLESENLLFTVQNGMLTKGVADLITHPTQLALHIYMLSVNGPAPDFENKTIRAVHQKIKSTLGETTPDFTAEEEKYCLYQPDILNELALFQN